MKQLRTTHPLPDTHARPTSTIFSCWVSVNRVIGRLLLNSIRPSANILADSLVFRDQFAFGSDQPSKGLLGTSFGLNMPSTTINVSLAPAQTALMKKKACCPDRRLINDGVFGSYCPLQQRPEKRRPNRRRLAGYRSAQSLKASGLHRTTNIHRRQPQIISITAKTGSFRLFLTKIFVWNHPDHTF